METETLGTWILISTIVGSILLMWLSYHDFSRKIIKPIRAGRYYLAFALFSVVNILVYLGLCSFFLGVDWLTAALQPTISREAVAGMQGSMFQVINPILIAVMYFATGSFTFKVGKAEIDLYQQLLKVFQRLLRLQFSDVEQIRKSIENTSAKLQVLREKIESLHSVADTQGWDRMEDSWKEVDDDVRLINEQVNYLTDMRMKLSSPANMDELRKEIDSKIEDMQSSQITKLKSYIFKFIIANIKKESDIDTLIEDLGGEVVRGESREQSLVIRCVVVCGLFGLLFGPVFAYFENVSVVRYSWYGAAALGSFGLIFSIVRNAKKNVKDLLVRAILSGGAAGLVAHAVWMFLRGLEQQLAIPFEYEKLVFGVEYGIVLGLVIFFFRTTTLELSTVLRVTGMGMLGGAAFALLGLLNKVHAPLQEMGVGAIGVYGMLVVLGVITTLGLATGLDIVKKSQADRTTVRPVRERHEGGGSAVSG